MPQGIPFPPCSCAWFSGAPHPYPVPGAPGHSIPILFLVLQGTSSPPCPCALHIGAFLSPPSLCSGNSTTNPQGILIIPVPPTSLHAGVPHPLHTPGITPPVPLPCHTPCQPQGWCLGGCMCISRSECALWHSLGSARCVGERVVLEYVSVLCWDTVTARCHPRRMCQAVAV